MALTPEERVALVTDLTEATRCVERVRSVLRPLGMVAETVDEIRQMNPGLGPELDRLGELVLEAGEVASRIVDVMKAQWEVKWGELK